MPVVPAKCPQCGADIEVDTTHEAGLCKNCGAPFVTEKVLKSQNTFITNNNNFSGANINIVSGSSNATDFVNFLNLSIKALDAGNGDESLEYANKALEINSASPEAWVAKMKSMAYLATFTDCKVNETIEYGKNAITYAANDDSMVIKEAVYSHYLQRALSLLTIATDRMNDTASVHNTLAQIRSVAPFGAEDRVSSADANNIVVLTKMIDLALLLKTSVPISEIEQNSNYQRVTLEICNQYIAFMDGLKNRLAIYNSAISENMLNVIQSQVNLLKGGLNQTDCQSVRTFNKTPPETSSNGCYIATCVYGSYDCPQVWTLRRFRDYTLDETWYGRLFIKCYYAISPSLVKWFGDTSWFKRFWKRPLDALVKMLHQKGVPDTSYHDKY